MVAFFQKIFNTYNLTEKQKMLFLLGYYSDKIIINTASILYLFAGFKTIILCSVHSIRLVEYMFSAKMWFVKISSKIAKDESRVAKSNPEEPL